MPCGGQMTRQTRRLTQSRVDRPGLGHAHLGAMDQGRDIEGIGIGIAVADEPSTCPRFENRSSGKDVSGDWIAVGHPIRETRGFDMTHDAGGIRRILASSELSIHDGRRRSC
jgi:hypothetical protein